jgi:ATP-binding cassette, subfamily C, bacterial
MRSEFARLVRPCGPHLGTAAVFSLAINLLYLAGPLYMLQVYDRVVPSGSGLTLVMLTLALLLAYLALAGLDAVRSRVLTRAAVRLDRRIAPEIMAAIIERQAAAGGARSQLLRDFDNLRQFLGGSGVHAVFDLPWAPIYIAVIFLLHWTMGAFALGCAAALILLTLVNEWLVHRPLSEANEAAARNYSFTEMSLRNVEAVRGVATVTACWAAKLPHRTAPPPCKA